MTEPHGYTREGDERPQVSARGYPANDWEVVTGEMVACPGCAFTFGAEHVTQATGQYDCPVCKAWSYDGVPSRPPKRGA